MSSENGSGNSYKGSSGDSMKYGTDQ